METIRHGRREGGREHWLFGGCGTEPVDPHSFNRARLSQEVSNGVPVVMKFVEEILVGNSAPSKPKALVCLRSWVQYGIGFE